MVRSLTDAGGNMASKALLNTGGIPSLVTVQDASKVLNCSARTITRRCASGEYPGAHKTKGKGGDGWMIPIAALPAPAQRQLAEQYATQLATRAGVLHERFTRAALEGEYRTLWDAYERKPASIKRMAESALEALQAYQELRRTGLSAELAKKAVADSHGVSGVTLWRYVKATEKHPSQHWLPLLCPKYRGGRGKAEFTPEAYSWILARYLTTSETKIAVLVKEARQEGAAKGWVIPSDDTVAKRLREEPAWITLGGRKGERALERSFPTVERDYDSLRLHELWESDGRKADVWCRWPDGSIGRPFIVIWREVRTRLVLSARGYRNPCAEVVIAAFGNAMERTGAVPQNAKIDNGPEYAGKAVTGGQKTRFRYHVKVGEPIGIMTRVGTKARWSKPAQGRDKPIESFWNVVAEHCDKAKEFEGAYCGKDTASKPEDFAMQNAVPLDAYAAKLAAVLEYFNNRPHTGRGMGGRSPLQMYEALAMTTEVKLADPAHVRLCRLASTQVKLESREASLRFKIDGYGERRYWCEALGELPMHVRQRKLQVYYDPENPLASVSVYDGESFICDAAPIEPIPFLESNGTQTRAHMEAKAAYLKSRRAALREVKGRGEASLPNLGASAQPLQLPLPVNAVHIDLPRQAPAIEPEQPVWRQSPDDPTVWVNSRTGEIRSRPVLVEASPRRRTPEELQALRQAQAEKNKPSWMKTPKTA